MLRGPVIDDVRFYVFENSLIQLANRDVKRFVLCVSVGIVYANRIRCAMRYVHLLLALSRGHGQIVEVSGTLCDE